jgi:hypothetical protein
MYQYSNGKSLIFSPSSIIFPVTEVGNTLSRTIVLKDIDKSGMPPIEITSLRVKSASSRYNISDSLFPQYLYPKTYYYQFGIDSLPVVISFTSTDSLYHHDTLLVSTDCYDIPIPIESKAETPMISAGDVDFGSIQKGAVVWKTIAIRNIGELPFVLFNYYLDNDRFSLDAASIRKLPLTIKPNGSANFTIVYDSKQPGEDTSRIIWNTDIDYTHFPGAKNYSLLKARSVAESGVDEEMSGKTFMIYPNPASGNSVSFSFPSIPSNSILTIIDPLGREVYRKAIPVGLESTEISLRNLDEGIYYAKWNSVIHHFLRIK